MNRVSLLVSAALLSATSWAGTNLYGETNPEYDGKLSDLRHAVPPAFSAQTDPESALRDYPLGVVTKQVAFSRHGPPHKVVTLANGEEGWVYEIPHRRERKTYTLPSGARVSVKEIPANAAMHTFTLDFCDGNGVVDDVIYQDDVSGARVTAAEMQTHKMQPRPGAPIP